MGSNEYYAPANYYGQNSQSNGQQSFAGYESQSSTTPYNQNFSTEYHAPAQHPNQGQGQDRNRASVYATTHQSHNASGWNGSYEGAQDGRAAEALRNLSNTAYNNGGALSSPGMQAATTAAHRYTANSQQTTNNRTTTPPAAYVNRPSRPASTAGQTQSSARYGLPMPASVAFPSQTTYTTAGPQTRTEAPASYARPTSHARDPSNASRSDHNSNTTQTPSRGSPKYQHPTPNSVTGTYGSTTTSTVDPIQVYDPWPEIQRKQEAARAAKAAEDAIRAEAARRAEQENARKAEEERARLAEEQRIRAEQESALRAEEAQRQAEALKAKQKEDEKKVKDEERKRKRAESKKKRDEAKAAAAASNSPAVQNVEPVETAEEAEIRALMAKMRQYNTKNPTLLAKIWEEERKAQGTSSQSPTVQHKPTPVAQATTQSVPIKPTKGQTNGVKATPTPQSMAPAVQPPGPAVSASRAPSARPAPKSSAGALWPPEKREALAAAAARWLNSQPANVDKIVSAKEICDKLDKNPTYIELCEWFESRAIKLDRASFARHLLEAVPDVNSAYRQHRQRDAPKRSPSTTTPLNGAPTSLPAATSSSTILPTTIYPGPSVAYESPSYAKSPYTASGPRNDGASTMSNYPDIPAGGSTTPYFTPDLPVASSYDSDNAPPVDDIGSALTVPKPVMSQPKSKEEAARKRNFSDLIDLTAISDEDDPLPPKRINTGTVSYTSQAPVANSQIPPKYDVSATETTFQWQQPNTSQPATNAVRFGSGAVAPAPSKDDLSQLDVVKPFDRKNALRRSTYNSKTIARDVLLATGRHPDMRPLNAHLDILKTTFRYVDNFSDLSTFRWGLVDPGEPPKEMLMNTLDGDLADDEDDDSDDEERRQLARPRMALQQAVITGGNSVTSMTMVPSTPTFHKIPKRRGRPPLHGRSGTTRPYGFGDGEPQPQSAPVGSAREHRPSGYGDRRLPSSQSGPSQTPSSNPSGGVYSAPGKGTGYAAFQQFAADGTPIKRKGRPVGWRKAIHGSAAAQSHTSYPTRGGRPPSTLRNATTVNERTATTEPSNGQKRSPERSFSVFKCGWKDCVAELHNLNTLRKHVFKVHRKFSTTGGLDCLWSGCGRDVKERDENGHERSTRKPLWFSLEEQWKAHIELQHLQSIAWTQGDGPASGLSDAHDSEMSEAYMSDSRGRRVTPRITSASGQPSSQGQTTDQPRKPGRPPKKPVEEEAREAQRDLENRKRSFGPGVDQGGSRLATDKRRMGFIDDEHIEEVVDAED
ncbi:hypothetical protein EJ05DRAFT_472865 [Pseudovirgaria hyperparasitica]|uniref:C2H2-type domain-containing protein n=1 Tax=Pseudovirgaria hyperparasitica TaxID=470096 RepID=A0A6A6WIG6_9PEZI|nr:uncharacterized protein EJ05DRAFT_472865 [Pseudovirgaria hyperparasitica]KAF2761915.1 hypothetical protein EJ05DRAFT_472865 [Pseudovirgaria hyperparasitica]